MQNSWKRMACSTVCIALLGLSSACSKASSREEAADGAQTPSSGQAKASNSLPMPMTRPAPIAKAALVELGGERPSGLAFNDIQPFTPVDAHAPHPGLEDVLGELKVMDAAAALHGFDQKPSIDGRGAELDLQGCQPIHQGVFGPERSDGGLTGLRTYQDCGSSGYVALEESDYSGSSRRHGMRADPSRINASVLGRSALYYVEHDAVSGTYLQSLRWVSGDRRYSVTVTGAELRSESWMLDVARRLEKSVS